LGSEDFGQGTYRKETTPFAASKTSRAGRALSASCGDIEGRVFAAASSRLLSL